jgi:DNA-directed RNA polymerase I, II, and III subunit RPABC2
MNQFQGEYLDEEENPVDEENVDVLGATEQNNKEQKEKKTTRFMTKYERARVLGTRALQIRFIFKIIQPTCSV